MRIIFVRHGEPDYAHDCLTETGRRQAAAVAERLAVEGIDGIWTSPMGRAAETAEFTARRLGLPVRTLDFMHEVSWGGVQAEDVPEEGHPWTLADRMIAREDFDFYASDWRKHPYFAENAITRDYGRVAAAFDGFLRERGYAHEGTRFLCGAEKQETVAVFSHGGSGACVLAHLLALPLPYVCTVMPYDYTSVIILNFPVRPGEYVHPRIELFNDTAHIRGSAEGPKFQAKPDEAPGLEEAPEEDPAHVPTVWMIGDSTMDNAKEPFRGWGWAFPRYVREGVRVENHGASGRSSRSFREEGRFIPVKEGMRPGDLLIIQFGHNDEKDDERHTDPETTYTQELRAYCEAALRAGALPVLVTPVSRRFFSGKTSLMYTHGEYPRAVRVLAEELGIPMVDLEKASRRLYLTLGEEETATLFVRTAPGELPDYPDGHDDRTHFCAKGSAVIAGLAAEEMRRDPRCAKWLREDWRDTAAEAGIPEPLLEE